MKLSFSRLCFSFLLLVTSTWVDASSIDNALVQAIREANQQKVERLLDSVDLNQILPDGSTALSWAVEAQDPHLVALLLNAGASPNVFGNSAVAPLILACQYGQREVLELLLVAHADVNVAHPEEIRALSLCAAAAPAAIVAKILEAGADVLASDMRGQNALMYAAAHGKADNVAVLLKHDAPVNTLTKKGMPALFFALKGGNQKVPVMLREAGADLDYVMPDGTTAVQMAIYQKNYAFAEYLIGRGVNLAAYDHNGNQLLHAAVKAGQTDLVTLLIQAGVELEALTGESDVTWRYERNFSSAKYYIPPKTALFIAAELGDAAMMKVLLDAGADPAFKTDEGMNLVLAAVVGESLAALELALSVAPNPNITNNAGKTPIHLLLTTGTGADGTGPETVEMLKLLASIGARTDIADNSGVTAYELASGVQAGAKAAFEKVFVAPAQRQ